MHLIILRTICFHLIILIILLLDGCSSVHPGSGASSNKYPCIELKKEYGFSSKETITIYVIPSGRDKLDETYLRVLQMDLQSRGFKIINANQLLFANSDIIQANSFRHIVDSLTAIKYLPLSDIIIIARPIWERVYFAPDYLKKVFGDHKPNFNKHMFVRKLSSYVAIFDPKLHRPILSFAAIDTTRLFSEKENDIQMYQEYPWMIAARQLTKGLKDIPICRIVNSSLTTKQFSVILWVDKSYRAAFPETWKDRLILRVLFANDILRSQFDIELVVSEFKEWDSRFETKLESTLLKLESETTSNSNEFQIGITLDNTLKTNWLDKSKIGFAFLLGERAVITGQPSLPEVGDYWNPIVEAITLVHEVGHLFGAIHVADESSIMYPSSGFLFFEFDDANKKIIESTKNNFFNCDKKQRVRNYIQKLIAIRKTSGRNSIPILPAITSVVYTLYPQDSLNYNDYEILDSLLTKIINNSLYRLAVTGYIEYNLHNFKQAKIHFEKVIESYPDFTEVHWYLSKVYRKMGNKRKADRHRNIAKRNKNLLLLDDK